MSPNRFLILFLLPLLAACPAKSKSPLLFLGEMSASAILPTDWVQDAYLKASNAGAGESLSKNHFSGPPMAPWAIGEMTLAPVTPAK